MIHTDGTPTAANGRHLHIRSAYSRCNVCGKRGVYNMDERLTPTADVLSDAEQRAQDAAAIRASVERDTERDAA